jgi:hypothetical protein
MKEIKKKLEFYETLLDDKEMFRKGRLISAEIRGRIYALKWVIE